MSEIVRISDGKEWEKLYKKGLDAAALEKLMEEKERQPKQEAYEYPNPEPTGYRMMNTSEET